MDFIVFIINLQGGANMPFKTSMSNSGGNMNNELQRKLEAFVEKIDDHITRIAREKRMVAVQVRLLQQCSIVYLANEQMIFCSITNYNVGIPIRRYIDVTGSSMNLDTAIFLSVRDLAFQDPFGIQFSRSDIEVEEEANSRARAIAEYYIDDEIKHLERMTKIVRMNPIFTGRDFMMDDSLVFMLSPFTEVFNNIYNDHIKPTVESIDSLQISRADNIYDNSPIMEDIWTSINQSRIIIAELTGKNPNVFYETGIAHTVGKEVILLTQLMEDVPFDLRHLRCIVYEYTPRGIANLESNLRNTIINILKRPR